MKSNASSVASPRRGGVNWGDLNWTVIIAIGLLHVLCVGVFFPQLFSWSGLGIMAVLMWVSGGLGITLCFHRLLTHASFKTPSWFRYLLTLCGCIAWQGSPVDWVGVHRLHHKHSDGDLDPHSPTHGFTWSHITWTLHKRLDGISGKDAAKDLLRDKGLRFINRFHVMPQIFLAIALLLLGWATRDIWLGLSWVLWGVAVRTVLVYHGTWFVNSAAHTWGYQNYKNTGERSTNLWWVALVSFGEGWHNNHHAHPRSAAHGLRWFEVDMTFLTIKLLSLVGLARDIKLPAADEMPGVQPQQAEVAIAAKADPAA